MGNAETALDAVFMETKSPIGSSEMGACYPTDFAMSGLGSDGLWGICGMVVSHSPENSGWVDVVAVVEGDTKRFLGLDALKDVHVVSYGYAIPIRSWNVVIPRCPSQSAFGQYARVRVQYGLVFLVEHAAKHFALRFRRIPQEFKGLIAMTGQDDLVEGFNAVIFRLNSHPVWITMYAFHWSG